MPQILEVIGPKSGTAPLQYKLTELGTVDLMSIFAHFDGAAASGDWRPTVTIRAQNGTILARIPVDETLPTGDTADVTFAPFLRASGGGGGGGGIMFDTTPQTGGFLEVATTGVSGSRGVHFSASGGNLDLETSGGTNSITLYSGYNLNLQAASRDVTIDAYRHMLLDAGTGTSGVLVMQASDSVTIEGATMDLNAGTFLSVNMDAGTLWVNSGSLRIGISPGNRLYVTDDNGDPIFAVDEDGDLHGKTGKALVFDL